MKEEVTTGVSGVEGKEEPLSKKVNKRKKKRGSDMKFNKFTEAIDKGGEPLPTGTGKKMLKDIKKGKEGQDEKGAGKKKVTKEYYVSPNGFVLVAEAGALKRAFRKVGNKIKKVAFKTKRKSGPDVTKSGKIRTRGSVKKNIKKMGGKIKMRLRKIQRARTMRKKKGSQLTTGKKTRRLNK